MDESILDESVIEDSVIEDSVIEDSVIEDSAAEGADDDSPVPDIDFRTTRRGDDQEGPAAEDEAEDEAERPAWARDERVPAGPAATEGVAVGAADAAAGANGVAAAEEAAVEELSISQLQSAIEAILFSTAEPVTIRQLAEVFETSVHDVREAVENLRLELVDTQRAFRLNEVAGGLQLLTLPAYHRWVSKFRRRRKEQRLSNAALETLAVIAYKQPISKAALEGIRGVQCGPTLKTLLDRGLIKIVGREESLGRPLLYGTTPRFLENFGLASLSHLPQPELDRAASVRAAGEEEAADGTENPST